jgi:type IV pilus assembly protein PilM
VALVNVGASVMNINVLHDGNSVFWRDVAFGGNLYTEAIQREFNLPREDAEKVKLGEEVGQVSKEQVDSVLGAASEDLAAELQKTIDFFVATSSVDRLDRVMLSGGGSLVAKLDSILQERFQVNVELLNPFRNIRYNESDFDPDWINSNAPAMAVAVGLAIRTVGD